MDIFSIDVTLNELLFIRQALDIVSVSGKDAKFLASLQMKCESEIDTIQQLILEDNVKKQEELQALIETDAKKSASEK